ncbi:MAG: DEAD/DEAH box helicase [Sedimentisphaerales bacterium]|nr:DEAD/DEAH box helicase [Sedimentisphaerales bacterium]
MISFQEQGRLDIDQILGQEGLLSRSFAGFESRPQQVEMACAIQKAFDNGRHLCVEAGTGTGKSFAYLMAAIDQVQRKKKVLVSTYTITLQQQLINKDIPLLGELLEYPFSACLAKGRNNYLCLRRLDYAQRHARGLFDDALSDLMRIAAWAGTTEDGSLSDLDFTPDQDAWDAVMSEHGNCRGRKCEHFPKCFYWRARRQLKTADIIVANHALLFSDLALKEDAPGFLPSYDLVVIDEAHNMEHVAEEHFGINISNFTFTYLLGRLYNPRRRKGLLAFLPGADAAVEAVRALDKASKLFFTQVQAWYEHAEKETFGRCQPGFVQDNITTPIRDLRAALSKLSKQSKDEDDRSEFTRYIDRCRSLEMELQDFLTQSKETSVYWVEIGGGRRKRIALRSAPLDVGPDVKRCLFDKFSSVVTTSATLSCGAGEDKNGFSFFASRIGLSEFDAVRLGSPFDYPRQVTLYLEADMPAPTQAEFGPAATEKIKQYLLQSDGRAFVLFTSYSMLQNIAERIGPFMAEQGMELLIQGGGTDRSILLDRFKEDHRSVLFGTDSFWQGVDVPGEALSNVIIVRLPFAVPNHPLIQGRIEALQARGENPFWTYQLPTAIIKFKQGFGRLIRNKTDTGIIVVLDSRIVKRNYGRLFLEAIPPCTVEVVRDKDDPDSW